MTSIPIPKNPFPNPHDHRIRWTPLTGHIDLDIIGHLILSKDKSHFKIMLYKQFDGDFGYFRGQNRDYPTFKTSWQKLDTPLKRCLGWIQKEEFLTWFGKTPYFQHFAKRLEFSYKDSLPEGQGAKFCFDFEAIAQHYEFPTNYLDITTKRDIAEFFAYTYKDEKTGLCRPIEDFNKFQPYLFKSTASKHLNNPYNKDIRIVGFQPLLRPILQYAMAINFDNPSVDYNNEFHKIPLEQSKKRAFEIFDKYKGGEDIFPTNDYASAAAKSIKTRIEQEKIINYNAFLKYCKEFKENPNDIGKRLDKKGYWFSSDELQNTPETLDDMQKHIDEKLVPWIKEFVSYSPSHHSN
ncbi:FRG domain-containing protein [bacterium]|nr:FRG domain-containing protein [bacterium]